MNHHVDLAEKVDPDPHQRPAGVVAQGDPIACRVWTGRPGPLEGARQLRAGLGFPSGPLGVEKVALAFVTAAASAGCSVRRNVANVEVGGDEKLGEMTSEARGVLHAPSIDRPKITSPLHCCGVARIGVVEMVAAEHTAPFVKDRSSEGATVRINTNDVA